MKISESVFADGESPLKESSDIDLVQCLFRWKYPLWYSKNITIKDSTLFDMARAGIWYTDNISLENTIVEAPKNFRRCNGVKLNKVSFPYASGDFMELSECHNGAGHGKRRLFRHEL